MTASWHILEGDCRDVLRTLPERSVQTVCTSPPYFGLRDYGTGEWEGGDPACDHLGMARGSTASTLKTDGRPNPGQNDYERDVRVPYREECGRCGARRVDRQIGLEPSPDEFVQALVGVFRAVRRVLRDDGTVWLNLGDSYSGSGPSGASYESETTKRRREQGAQDGAFRVSPTLRDRGLTYAEKKPVPAVGTKPKDLIGIPWMVAFALRADGWYLRSEIIWHKPNPMPESVTDRPTKAHEQVFLLSKGPRYFYDARAIAEPGEPSGWSKQRATGVDTWAYRRTAGGMGVENRNGVGGTTGDGTSRNKRSVWAVATAPYPGAHFATFPPKLIEPCILAGSSPKACGVCGAPWQRVVEREGASRTVGWEPSCAHQDDTGQSVVLDPFAGAGTTGMVALRHDRSFIGIELSPEYVRLARDRIIADSPLLNTHAEKAA